MHSRKTTAFYTLLVAVASLAVGVVLASRLGLAPISSAQSTAPPPVASSSPLSGPLTATTFRDIASEVTPAVVSIRVESRQARPEVSEFFGGDDLFERFFGGPDNPAPEGNLAVSAGTGFIVDRDGFIVTNNHVVENADKIEVALYGDSEGELHEARVIGRDPLTDSALIQLIELPDTPLPVVAFGDSAIMQPGDWVMAIGNPFGLAHTVSVGVISGIGRLFEPVQGRRADILLQTDAAINPGNSGGPLINLRGEVIGINTAIYSDSRSQGNIGIGFAVPMNTVRELLPELRTGQVTRGVIGISVRSVPEEAVDEFGLTSGAGALIATVASGGPAAVAGLEPGDVILTYNGDPVADEDALVRMVVATRPGTEVPVRVVRDRQEQTVTVTIGALDLEAPNQVARGGGNNGTPPEQVGSGFGLTLGNITPAITEQLQLGPDVAGSVVTAVAPRRAADLAGLVAGDIILEVNRAEVGTAAQASQALRQVPAGGTAFLLVFRGGEELFLTVTRE